MPYTSVRDYTCARCAEMAGVAVAVVGDSLAMVADGHPSTIPATMDMMALHARAVRRGAPTRHLGRLPGPPAGRAGPARDAVRQTPSWPSERHVSLWWLTNTLRRRREL